jgi:hypothetical protein
MIGQLSSIIQCYCFVNPWADEYFIGSVTYPYRMVCVYTSRRKGCHRTVPSRLLQNWKIPRSRVRAPAPFPGKDRRRKQYASPLEAKLLIVTYSVLAKFRFSSRLGAKLVGGPEHSGARFCFALRPVVGDQQFGSSWLNRRRFRFGWRIIRLPTCKRFLPCAFVLAFV